MGSISDGRDKPINGFFNQYEFLSNFHPAPVEFEGVIYPTVENAYQAAKSRDPKTRERFVNITPGQAKKLGQEIEIREDWEAVKLGVMFILLFEKIDEHEDLLEKLVETGNAHLEETNTWDDKYWRVCDGVGENHLGILLMTVRGAIAIERGIILQCGSSASS